MTGAATTTERAGLSAGAWPRLKAMAIDLTVVAGWAAFAAVAGSVARASGFDFATPRQSDTFAFATLVAPVILTFAFQEASARRATFGKHRLGLVVTDRSGRRLGLGRALTRSAVKFLPWQLAHTAVFGLVAGSTSTGLMVLAITAQALVVASVIAMAIDPRHRAFHDWLAGTQVSTTGLARSESDHSSKKGKVS
jgi:uncharacterized RDD family membrane protein YckC